MINSLAAICQHIKDDGIRCGSPAMKNAPWCFFHRRIYEAPIGQRKTPYRVGAMESTASVQIVLTHTLQALMDDTIDTKKANALFRGLSLALQTLRPSQKKLEWKSDALVGHLHEQAEPCGAAALGRVADQEECGAAALDRVADNTQSAEQDDREPRTTAVIVHKKPPRSARLTDSELASIRKIMRLGPKHPEFRRSAQRLDAHIAAGGHR